MWQAFLWGGIASASIFIGEALAGPLGRRPHMTGMIMGFGAGALLSAVAYELIPPATLGKGLGRGIGVALLAGAVVYLVADRLADGAGGATRSQIGTTEPGAPESASGFAMFIGTLLDGVPESFILGVGLALGGSISIAFVAAIIVSNVPQGIAGTLSLKAAGHSDRQVFLMWSALTLASASIAAAGFLIASAVPVNGIYSQAFAAGALLIMLADSMMPEAFEHGGRSVGLTTVLGYLVAATLSFAG